MSGSRAKALRREAGGFKRKQKTPTPILEVSYIQAPVAFEFGEGGWQHRYRSPKQVRRYLARRGVDVEALAAELEALMAEYEASKEAELTA